MASNVTTQSTREPVRLLSDGRASLLVYGAASFSLIAALIHFWVAPEHIELWWAYGAFFLISAFAQGLASILILRFPASKLISIGSIVGNFLIVLLYVISRTWGMPFGESWVPFDPSVAHLENADVLGMIATASEIAIIVSLAMLLDGAYRKWILNTLLFVGIVLWSLRFTGILP